MLYSEAKKILEGNGYSLVRINGLNTQFKNDLGSTVVVKNYGSKVIPSGILRKLEKCTGLSF